MEDAALEFLMDPINRFPFREEFAATLSIQIRLVLLPCCDAHPAMPADSNGRSGCAQDEGPQANYDEERMLLQIGPCNPLILKAPGWTKKVIFRCTHLLRTWSTLQEVEYQPLFKAVCTRLEQVATVVFTQHGWQHNLRIGPPSLAT
ncbi:uncharacterized protein [Triticum aestivum]|uniref:uncharacterized protein isoform X1 n=1 Tax=Triticum aestivum TaxID=4565 RepID=UPI001D034603|nr:uncharacterized protein LOC123040436 isoform X1 [Triticum aestivum]